MFYIRQPLLYNWFPLNCTVGVHFLNLRIKFYYRKTADFVKRSDTVKQMQKWPISVKAVNG